MVRYNQFCVKSTTTPESTNQLIVCTLPSIHSADCPLVELNVLMLAAHVDVPMGRVLQLTLALRPWFLHMQ